MQQQRKLDLPKRLKGKRFNEFRDVQIETNYYSVKIQSPIDEIHIYKVVYSPMIPSDNIKQRMSLLQKGLDQIKEMIPSPVLSGANIYSLKPPVEKERDITVDEFTIKIKEVKVIQVKENPRTLLMFLNNGLRNLFGKIGYIEIGKSSKFFKVTAPETVDNDIKMFPGFKANFMSLERGIYLRVDSAKKIVRNESVLDFINQTYALNKNKERDEKRTILKAALIGQVIMTNYGKSRYLRVVDVIFESVDEYKLNNSETTLRQFYEKKYNRKVDQPKQPLIEVETKPMKNAKEGDNNKCVLIPEMCLMTGIPDNFDEFKRKKISERTILDPSRKKKDIQHFMEQAKSVSDFASLQGLGIKIDSNLNRMKAKLLPAPRLQFGNNRAVEQGRQANFQLFRDPIYRSEHSLKLGIFATQNGDPRGLIDTFKNTARNLNVKLDIDTFCSRENDKGRILNSYFSEIENSIRKSGINIALIVIPNFMKTSYGEIKQECLNKLNIVTQCVVEATLRKKNLQSIATKLLLQMIAKRGNILWVPKTVGKINDAMILAFDTSKGSKNMLACCGTVNETFSSYYSRTASYGDNEDKFVKMKILAAETIDYSAKVNKRCPREVIIFHNSSTGDQINIFKTLFIEPLNQKLKQVFKADAPKLSLVMVNVKTSERFFLNGNGGTMNVNAGTIVAEDIVSQNYDFFLVSQGSNRGTTVPNHYKIVYSDSQIEEGLLHELIFSQCFNYVNWTGSIKIPGILQYAKKCAKFSTEAMNGQLVKEDLDCKLYYV